MRIYQTDITMIIYMSNFVCSIIHTMSTSDDNMSSSRVPVKYEAQVDDRGNKSSSFNAEKSKENRHSNHLLGPEFLSATG